MNEIDSGLWISDIDAVRESSTQRFDVVITVCQDDVKDNVGCPNPHYPLADDEQSAERWGGTTDYEMFEAAAMDVVGNLARVDVDNVLVHCHSGQNRSAAVCIAALAVYRIIGFGEAYELVREARPIINPTVTMIRHAKRFIVENT